MATGFTTTFKEGERRAMKKWIVEFFLNGKVILTFDANANSRKEAYFACIRTQRYKDARDKANKLMVYLTWKAEEVNESSQTE